MITNPPARISGIILAITLTMLLITSPVMTVLSPSLLSPIALKVEFASATSSSENNDDNEGEEGGGGEEQPTTDVTTDGEEEEVDGNSGDVQQEGATEEDDEEEGGDGQQEQFATVVGEICDDFEDNDADGLIDLADADCAAPLTEGTVTAAPPTTPASPPSVINSTATNSTNNTLTASEITTTREITTPSSSLGTTGGGGGGQQPQQDSPYIVEVCDNRIDDDGDGLADLDDFEGCAPPSTSSNTRYMTPSGDIVDVTGCTSFEEMGIEPGSPSPGDPPNLVYFDCDNITWGLIPLDSAPATTTSDSGTGTAGGEGQQGLAQGQGQQPQQQPNSPSSCPPQPTNYYDATAQIIHVQLTPSSQTTTNPCPPGESSSSATTPQSPQAPPPSPFTTRPQEPQQQQEVEICNDGVDNDGNGLIDFLDNDCAAAAAATAGTLTSSAAADSDSDSDTGREGREICDDFEDNDGDGLIDSADADCAAPLTEGTVTSSAPTTTTRDDGGITTAYPDGLVVTAYPNGLVRTDYPDGTYIIKNGRPAQADDEFPHEYIPGNTYTRFPDGSTFEEHPDFLAVMVPEFGYAMFNNDGTVKFIPLCGTCLTNVPPQFTEMFAFLLNL